MSGNRRVVLLCLYFLLGISTTIFSFAIRKDLQAYHLPMAMVSYQLMVPNLPWTFKCFMAIISDTVQCCGYNKKPYLIVTNLLSVVFCVLLLTTTPTLGQYIGIHFGLQFFAAWADVIYDTLMIYEANIEEATRDGVLQSRINICRILGRIVGKTGPLIWETVGSKGVFGVMVGIYIIAATIGALMYDIPRPSNPTGTLVNPLSSSFNHQNPTPREEEGKMKDGPSVKGYQCRAVTLIWQSLQHPILRTLLLFNLISSIIPSASVPTFFFLNDIVHMTPTEITLLQIIGELTELFTMVLYERFFSSISIRTIYGWVCVLKMISGILPYFLVARADDTFPKQCHHDLENKTLNTTCFYFEQYNIPPFPLALGDNVIGEALDELQALPLALVTKTVCFHVLGATVYTFTLALQNLVSGLRAAYVDPTMMTLFDIDHGKFNALPDLVKFCSVLDGITLCLVGLLPNYSTRTFRERVEEERTITDITNGISLEYGEEEEEVEKVKR
jgi:hypothetical protein